MIITYGNNDDSLKREAVTKDELAVIIQSNKIVNLHHVENTEIENGFFEVLKGITDIKANAFRNCTSLTTITLPEGITNIKPGVFRNCSRLTTITLPHSLTHIESSAFIGCSGLTSINLPESSLTNIGYSAFYGCSGLTNISLPEGLTNISPSVFNGCTSLTTITLPEGITNIEPSTFLRCSSLTSINLPDSLTNIGYSAFYGCSALTNISLPGSLTNIESCAFYGCSSLTTITLPNSLTSIGASAFNGCSNLQTIIIYGDENKVKIVTLLPEALRDKVISISLPEEVLLAPKETIIELAATPQLSSLYKWRDYLKPPLPNSILGEINSYLVGDESLHLIFKTGLQAIKKVSLNHFFRNPSEYTKKLSDIKEHYKKIAEETIKPSIKWQFYVAKKETSMKEEKTKATVTKKP